MRKDDILSEIVRTATVNGGTPLGVKRFESETGIKQSDWLGIHWAKWNDAVQEAGFTPNELQSAFGNEFLIGKFAENARELGRIPTKMECRMRRRNDVDFPHDGTYENTFGAKANLIKALLEFCRTRQGFENLVEQCENYLRPFAQDEEDPPPEKVAVGYVYLLKHGSRRQYKIGFTNNRLRREGEIGIELPEKIEPIHVIETDDPPGVEAYWHRRFADKRLEGEWFELTADDVRAFKR